MEKLKFFWERIKEKKLGYLILLVILALVWLPTFTGEDLFTVIPLITILGFKVYLTIAIIIIGLLIFFVSNGKLNLKSIKSLFKKPKDKEVKRICAKMHKTETAVNTCIKRNVMKNFSK